MKERKKKEKEKEKRRENSNIILPLKSNYKKFIGTYLSILFSLYIILKNKTGIIFYVLFWLNR